jgi:hypothetical protein
MGLRRRECYHTKRLELLSYRPLGNTLTGVVSCGEQGQQLILRLNHPPYQLQNLTQNATKNNICPETGIPLSRRPGRVNKRCAVHCSELDWFVICIDLAGFEIKSRASHPVGDGAALWGRSAVLQSDIAWLACLLHPWDIGGDRVCIYGVFSCRVVNSRLERDCARYWRRYSMSR